MKSIRKFYRRMKQKFDDWKMRRKIKKRLKEIRDRDPFIYD
jgi:predicted Holliday junction resolvase-like endonuclease